VHFQAITFGGFKARFGAMSSWSRNSDDPGLPSRIQNGIKIKIRIKIKRDSDSELSALIGVYLCSKIFEFPRIQGTVALKCHVPMIANKFVRSGFAGFMVYT